MTINVTVIARLAGLCDAALVFFGDLDPHAYPRELREVVGRATPAPQHEDAPPRSTGARGSLRREWTSTSFTPAAENAPRRHPRSRWPR